MSVETSQCLLRTTYQALCHSRLALSLSRQAFSEREQRNGPLPATERDALAAILVAEKSLMDGLEAIRRQRRLYECASTEDVV